MHDSELCAERNASLADTCCCAQSDKPQTLDAASQTRFLVVQGWTQEQQPL